jgi:hypothetical protein
LAEASSRIFIDSLTVQLSSCTPAISSLFSIRQSPHDVPLRSGSSKKPQPFCSARFYCKGKRPKYSRQNFFWQPVILPP